MFGIGDRSRRLTKEKFVASSQYPIPSGFAWKITAMEALNGKDLRGKAAIVTGRIIGHRA
jgi:hypothetical protein